MTHCSMASRNSATWRDETSSFQEFAAEMVRLNVAVIIVVTTHTALAVKKATTTIPIMHPNAIDPLNTGLICQPCAPRWESYGRRGS